MSTSNWSLSSLFDHEFHKKYMLLELLAVIWILYIWELYLSIRQRKLMKRLETLPQCLEGIMTDDVYKKARLYALDKNLYGNIHEFYSTIINTVFMLCFSFRYCWEWSGNFVQFVGFNSNEILESSICLLIMSTISVIIDLPFKIYNVFILEETHGFNKMTAKFFIRDQILSFLIAQIIGPIFLSGFIWIVQNGGDYFFFYIWIFTVVLTLFMSIIYPEVIAPLFDKYSPLPEGELKTKIEELAASLKFPLYKLYIVEGSKRSSHSNAYMYGFHKHKRIVLFDTLVKEYCKANEKSDRDFGCEVDEVVAILAHELGHWQFNHTIKGLLLAQICFVMNFVPFAMLLNYQPMYDAFGFTDCRPIFIGLIIVVMFILTPLNTMFSVFVTINSRRFEFQADEFGKKLGYGSQLRRALIKLQKDNLSYPLFDKLFSGWHHSHPPLLERLEHLDKQD